MRMNQRSRMRSQVGDRLYWFGMNLCENVTRDWKKRPARNAGAKSRGRSGVPPEGERWGGPALDPKHPAQPLLIRTTAVTFAATEEQAKECGSERCPRGCVTTVTRLIRNIV